MLLHGDDYQVQTASKAIIEVLVPADRRELNVERFDGRSAPWDQIEGALMTPPFFPGTKAVFVENAPYFLSRDQKGELEERVFELWAEQKRDEAAKLFMDLLVLDGWNQKRWEELQSSPPSNPAREIFGPTGRGLEEEIAALLTYCQSQGMGLSRLRGSDEHRLLGLVEQGLPDWDFLLITASQVDRRTRLYKRFGEKGAILDLGLQRDRSGRISRESLNEFLERRLKEGGKRIEPEAREMILLRAGDELWALHLELEKLLLYVGEDPMIRVHDVEDVFLDQGEGWIFDLTRSVAERDTVGALAHLARLLAQGEHPLKLLGTIAAELRRLLAARQLVDGEMRDKWRKGMTYAQFQSRVLEHGPPLLGRNPFADYMSFQKAENFTTAELLGCLERIYETDLRLKSTGNQPRVVMEKLLLEMSLGLRGKGASA